MLPGVAICQALYTVSVISISTFDEIAISVQRFISIAFGMSTKFYSEVRIGNMEIPRCPTIDVGLSLAGIGFIAKLLLRPAKSGQLCC